MTQSVGEIQAVLSSITAAGKEVLDITYDQMREFVANAIELESGQNNRVLALSQTAYNALTPDQKQRLHKYVELRPFDIRTIESAGGSIRCMIAENFLMPR